MVVGRFLKIQGEHGDMSDTLIEVSAACMWLPMPCDAHQQLISEGDA